MRKRKARNDSRTPGTAAPSPYYPKLDWQSEEDTTVRVFFLLLCVVFEAFAICLPVHLLPGMDEIAGSIEE